MYMDTCTNNKRDEFVRRRKPAGKRRLYWYEWYDHSYQYRYYTYTMWGTRQRWSGVYGHGCKQSRPKIADREKYKWEKMNRGYSAAEICCFLHHDVCVCPPATMCVFPPPRGAKIFQINVFYFECFLDISKCLNQIKINELDRCFIKEYF